MRKIIAIIISVAVIAATFSVCSFAFAAQKTDIPKTRIGTSETYYEFSAADKTLTLSGNGAIPNMSNNDSSQPWFYWRSDGSIEKVVVEEGITGIGNYVLYQVCAPEVQLPSTLKTIGSNALAYNYEITGYVIPFGVRSISTSAFENCNELVRVSLPDTLVTIGNSAFKQCYKLESVIIPHSVSTIGNYAFHRCSVLSSVTFESLSSPVKIGKYVFMSCPILSEISVPLNAKLGDYAFGFNNSKKRYENASMKVFSGSDALTYAKTRAVPYTLMDKIPINLGTVNKNEYIEETVNNVYTYSFVPEITQVYNIYSVGDTDLTGTLFDSSGELLTSDDISKDNLNFCLTYELEAGEEYIITVNSVRSVGEYAVIVYPDKIESFDISGDLSFNAGDGKAIDGGRRIFEINDGMLSDFILSINFGGDFFDRIYYSNNYFNNRKIGISDKQDSEPFTCGNNSEYIAIGEVESAFNVFVEHSYDEEIVEYTVDDDGYSIFTCILCGDNYKDNFVPTPAVTVSGRAVLMENPNGSHIHNIAYPYIAFFANERTYYTDGNGNWSVNTFDDLDLVFENENGKNVCIHIDVDGEDVDFGEVAFEGYDFNEDGYVNAKDFVVFLKQKQKKLGEDYWKYAYNFF